MLVCAATEGELAAFPENVEAKRLVTGVGIPATLAALIPRLIENPPDRILNIGIAGAYTDTGIAIGDIVFATDEVYGDIGFELPDEPVFRPITDSHFGAFYQTPFPLTPPPPVPALPTDFRVHFGRGCTVNACTGTNATGRRRAKQYNAVFETMEGAAVAQVGQSYNIPVCEIRAISNIAANRAMRPENIRHALENLGQYLKEVTRIGAAPFP